MVDSEVVPTHRHDRRLTASAATLRWPTRQNGTHGGSPRTRRWSSGLREHRFQDAAELLENARDRALASNCPEEAASYSGLLSTWLAILNRDQDAYAASQEAERLAPTESHCVVHSADLLLRHLHDPEAALEKLDALLRHLPTDDPSRYHALSLLGQAKPATGDADAALALFREITSPEMMQRLEHAEYAGVYDLGFVHALIGHGLASDECRDYLVAVRRVAQANGSTYVVADLDRLLAQITPPA
jgi:hypothetical protein